VFACLTFTNRIEERECFAPDDKWRARTLGTIGDNNLTFNHVRFDHTIIATISTLSSKIFQNTVSVSFQYSQVSHVMTVKNKGPTIHYNVDKKKEPELAR
jgi:hypothetical protein